MQAEEVSEVNIFNITEEELSNEQSKEDPADSSTSSGKACY